MKRIWVVGSLNMDLTVQTDRVPGSGETVSGYGFITNPGGKGANQAAAAAKLGGDVQMVGSVGQDGFGRQLTGALEANGAHVEQVRTAGANTGVAVIVVSQGDNRIILDAGANGTVTGDQVEAALAGAQEGDILVCQLEIPQEAVARALRIGRSRGMVTLLNPAPAAVLPDEFYENTHIIVPNEHECALLSGIFPEDEDSLRAAGEWFRARGVDTAVITLGSRGAALVDGEGLWLCPSRSVKAVDSTAAGDCFIGALCAALSRGEGMRRALWLGTRASALAVTRLGAQQSLPTEAELAAFIGDECHE